MGYPQIPENLEALSASELRSLAAEIRTAAFAVLNDDKSTPEQDAEADEYATKRTEILAIARAKEARAARAAALEDDSDDPTADPDDDEADDDDETTETPAPEQPVPLVPQRDDDGDDDDASTKAVAKTGRKVRTSTSVGASSEPPSDTRVHPDQLVAVEDNIHVDAGHKFESWLEIAEAVMDKAKMLDPGSGQKYHVARAYGQFDERHQLSEDLVANLRLFEPEEMTAALCAPAIPTYNLGCANSARRPVRNSLASFQPAQRGKVTIYPSPTLEDIDPGTGVGIWTAAMDANPGATKNACATIDCATPVEYVLYGIYRCITIKNMLQMTFPELVEAYLNRLSAAWARLAEVTLLNAMGTAVDTVESVHVGYGGTVDVQRAILQYLTAFQELQRWDNPEMDVWMHRGILMAMKADIVSRRRVDGGVTRIPSDGEINGIFNNAGITPHWTLDVGNWMTPLQQFQVNGVLRDFPRNVEMVIAPRGKFAVMDRGELNIGVTGNGMYRDNTSNSKNEFTFFFENYEGLVETDSCPAHAVELNNVCWNGQQAADVVVNCEGSNEVAAAS